LVHQLTQSHQVTQMQMDMETLNTQSLVGTMHSTQKT